MIGAQVYTRVADRVRRVYCALDAAAAAVLRLVCAGPHRIGSPANNAQSTRSKFDLNYTRAAARSRASDFFQKRTYPGARAARLRKAARREPFRAERFR